ncbi:MAG: nucleotidyltransferase family protein [Candidatus Omnitrophota bacterium]
MKGVILAAGVGKRLRPFTSRLPKPMLKVGGRPIIEYSIRLFRRAGVKEIFINLHYKPEAIVEYLGDGRKFGVHIRYFYERDLLGTAGALKNMSRLLKGGAFLVAYGDTLRNIDIPRMIKKHKAKNADFTVALYRVDDPKGCGIARMRCDNSICEFIEKPDIKTVSSRDYANCGLYIIEPRVLRAIPARKKYDFACDLFPYLLSHNYRIYGYPIRSYLLDIGTPSSFSKSKKIIHVFRNT